MITSNLQDFTSNANLDSYSNTVDMISVSMTTNALEVSANSNSVMSQSLEKLQSQITYIQSSL